MLDKMRIAFTSWFVSSVLMPLVAAVGGGLFGQGYWRTGLLLMSAGVAGGALGHKYRVGRAEWTEMQVEVARRTHREFIQETLEVWMDGLNFFANANGTDEYPMLHQRYRANVMTPNSRENPEFLQMMAWSSLGYDREAVNRRWGPGEGAVGRCFWSSDIEVFPPVEWDFESDPYELGYTMPSDWDAERSRVGAVVAIPLRHARTRRVLGVLAIDDAIAPSEPGWWEILRNYATNFIPAVEQHIGQLHDLNETTAT